MGVTALSVDKSKNNLEKETVETESEAVSVKTECLEASETENMVITSKNVAEKKENTTLEHRQGPSLDCENGDFKGSKASEVREHLATAHSEAMLGCESCDYRSSSQRKLRRHEATCRVWGWAGSSRDN